MAYIGFDLDETLGRFSIPDLHLYFVMPEALYSGVLKTMKNIPNISEDLRKKLNAAFNDFAACLMEKSLEKGKLLRPGILDIVGKLAALKDEGRVKAMAVYSNNGNLASLHLATTMIEQKLGRPGLFCNHVHWHNEMRYGPGKNARESVGSATKTVRVLREIFADPKCGGTGNFEDIPIESLYFFDDRNPVHYDLFVDLGRDRYFKVNPYKQDIDFASVDDCLRLILTKYELEKDPEYLDYIDPIFKSTDPPLPKEFNSIFRFLEMSNQGLTPSNYLFKNDTESILAKIDFLFPPRAPEVESAPSVVVNENSPVSYGLNYFPVVDGGERRRRQKRRKTIKRRKGKRTTRHLRARKN